MDWGFSARMLGAVVVFSSCVSGPTTPKDRARSVDSAAEEPEPESEPSDARAELSDGTCAAETAAGAPPLDKGAVNGLLMSAAERAWNCGLHSVNRMDLHIAVEIHGTGCVSDVALDEKLPSTMGECLMRRFKETKIPAYTGGPVVARVRMTNDRVWLEWAN